MVKSKNVHNILESALQIKHNLNHTKIYFNGKVIFLFQNNKIYNKPD